MEDKTLFRFDSDDVTLSFLVGVRQGWSTLSRNTCLGVGVVLLRGGVVFESWKKLSSLFCFRHPEGILLFRTGEISGVESHVLSYLLLPLSSLSNFNLTLLPLSLSPSDFVCLISFPDSLFPLTLLTAAVPPLTTLLSDLKLLRSISVSDILFLPFTAECLSGELCSDNRDALKAFGGGGVV